MRAAIGLARRGLGRTWPNPNVGCLIVADGRVVGRGWTQPGGRPHAETEALARAGTAARGATAYVSLEPCAHHGRTPPCADALVAAGLARVVVGCTDPDPRVDGRGIGRLRQAGVAVTTGCLEAEACEAVAGFLARVRLGRPLFTWKAASTLDGRIATLSGDSQWITGPLARARGHLLRATHDAIMVGSGTALADDPMLTCRLPGMEMLQPVRVVVDGVLRLAPDSRLARTARQVPVWVLTTPERAKSAAAQALADAGVEVMPVAAEGEGHVELAAVAARLGERGLTRVLVEGGGGLAAAMLRAELIDRIAWFRAASLVGGDGVAALPTLGIERIAHRLKLRRIDSLPVGDDLLETFSVAP
jgi:diaminohydroxyphosphoribosylaminopyrimidine deaminase/5-amino-6-(5-phosphoribosylamino)uracil reductase